MTPAAMARGAPEAVARPVAPCDDARPMHASCADVVFLSSARMASGMTSRARRQTPHPAG